MKIKINKNQEGQNGIQILMIISIILCITIFGTIFILKVQKKTRDSERITVLINLQKALDLYYDSFDSWPKGDDDGLGWDEGFHSESDRRFIQPLVQREYLPVTAHDPKYYGGKSLKYAVFEPGYAGCPINKGSYYVLGITELEADTRPATENTGSGFSCPMRDFGQEFDYVVGKFEK